MGGFYGCTKPDKEYIWTWEQLAGLRSDGSPWHWLFHWPSAAFCAKSTKPRAKRISPWSLPGKRSCATCVAGSPQTLAPTPWPLWFASWASAPPAEAVALRSVARPGRAGDLVVNVVLAGWLLHRQAPYL